jgi:creatinine amidohydrolase
MASTLMDTQWSTTRLRDARPDMAILPVASIERHGPHLPIGTDWIIVEAIAARVAERIDGAFLLPAFPFGTSLAHAGTPGTASVAWATLLHVVRDITESLMRQGIRKVAVINNLGGLTETTVQPRGNFIVKTAVRQLNYAHHDLDAIWVQPLTVGKEELAEVFESGRDDVHAGEVETSLLLALRPDLVQPLPADHVPTVPRAFQDWAPFERLAPGGVWGRPSLATKEKGERALEAAVRGTIRYIHESFAALEKAQGRAAVNVAQP